MKTFAGVMFLLGGLIVTASSLLPLKQGVDEPSVVQVEDSVYWEQLAVWVERHADKYQDTDRILSVAKRMPFKDLSRLQAWEAKNTPIDSANLQSILFTLRGAPPAPTP